MKKEEEDTANEVSVKELFTGAAVCAAAVGGVFVLDANLPATNEILDNAFRLGGVAMGLLGAKFAVDGIRAYKAAATTTRPPEP